VFVDAPYRPYSCGGLNHKLLDGISLDGIYFGITNTSERFIEADVLAALPLSQK